MSNHALLDEVYRRGVMNLIPEKTCAAHRIGADRVALVLVFLASNAGADCTVWHGFQAIARDLAMNPRRVREALAVLEAGGVIVRDGTRDRAIRYRLPFEAWPTPHRESRTVPVSRQRDQPAQPAKVPVSRQHDVAGEVAGEVAGNGAGIPVTKGREGNSSGAAVQNGLRGDPAPSGLLLPFDGEGQPDPVDAVLGDLVSGRARRWSGLRKATAVALDNGWTVAALVAHVRRRRDAAPRDDTDNYVWGIMRDLGKPEDEAPSAPQLGRSAWPVWCGTCNADNRMIEPDNGPARRCPDCHPLANVERDAQPAVAAVANRKALP